MQDQKYVFLPNQICAHKTNELTNIPALCRSSHIHVHDSIANSQTKRVGARSLDQRERDPWATVSSDGTQTSGHVVRRCCTQWLHTCGRTPANRSVFFTKKQAYACVFNASHLHTAYANAWEMIFSLLPKPNPKLLLLCTSTIPI